MQRVATILLSHQQPAELARTIGVWPEQVQSDEMLVTYGGTAERFADIAFSNKAFVDDERLRVRDQQRQFQSWRGVLRAALAWLKTRPDFDYVHLLEYDHVSLVRDLRSRLVQRAAEEGADVLAHHLHRVDDTSHPHYLFHSKEARFHEHFARISIRDDRRTVLSMLPTGSLWKRRAFEAVASREEPIPVYVELYLPTLAHHLGFRVRDLPDQNRFVTAAGDRGPEIESARKAGAWSLHPVKHQSPSLLSLLQQ